jgi:hypothetical protein
MGAKEVSPARRGWVIGELSGYSVHNFRSWLTDQPRSGD